MGYYMGVKKFFGKKNYALIGLLLASLLHGVYDFVLMHPGLDEGTSIMGFLLSIIFGFYYARKAIRMHQEISPFQ
jgi:RsiW-degrading membrane proteinase PrsW (M82 family)